MNKFNPIIHINDSAKKKLEEFGNKMSEIFEEGLINIWNSETECSPVTIEELVAPYGNECDEIIINSFQKESLNFIAGTISIKLINGSYFTYSTKL